MLKGKIVKNISNLYTVVTDNDVYNCQARGKFRNMALTPLVGDDVLFNELDNYIMDILPRKNELDRPHISNVDIALIVTSIKKPDLSLNLLDKEISSIILAGVEPVICFTKLDLGTKKDIEYIETLISYYSRIGIKSFRNDLLSELISYLKGKYVVLTGQTGAGKSSLINKIAPDAKVRTGEISKSLNRGKHTTRHTEFYEVTNIFIADTPGFSSLDLTKYTKEEIRNSFTEFKNHNCEFKDCTHVKEKNCSIKEKLTKGEIMESRYQNYCNFITR